MDKVVCTFSYGLCVISVEKIKVFLKEKKYGQKNYYLFFKIIKRSF